MGRADHRDHTRTGWTCTITDGVPHWTPPTWLDPKQTPLRNTAHNHHTKPPP
ncbi:MAG: hypothetical protein JO147_12835 [Actinobacteria bacterium]|nr:hypothetical protein [Actinomycetota bacterium]